MTNEPTACCAHLKVYYTTQSQDRGMTRGWWQCGDCWTRFSPVLPPEMPKPTMDKHLELCQCSNPNKGPDRCPVHF